jgi:hypothetical protein
MVRRGALGTTVRFDAAGSADASPRRFWRDGRPAAGLDAPIPS